jgi:hypothetical protein
MESIPMEAAPEALAWRDGELVVGTDGTAVWSGPYCAAYDERGTAAALYDGDRVVRELPRNDELPGDYDYPLALGRLPDGREAVVHCPEEYNVLQIEDAATGERLTTGSREPEDYFHSRLSLSPDGRHLLSVGWFWMPYGMARLFDVTLALTDATALDGEGLLPAHATTAGEVTAGCWLDADRVVLATGSERGPLSEPISLPARHLGVWSVSGGDWLHRAPVPDSDPGVLLLPRGDEVISLHGHPRLLDPTTGRTLAEWPEVVTPLKPTCFGYDEVPTPVAAVHPDGTLLAVAVADGITFITLP